MEWILRHQKDQGGCGGIAFRTETDPQEMTHPLRCETKCWACRAELAPHHWRLRNFQSDGGQDGSP